MRARPDFQAAFDAITADEATIVRDMERLLSCNTSFPPGDGYGAFADLLAPDLAGLGFACERVIVPEALWGAPFASGERVNVIARRGNDQPVCSLYFHVDTAPAGDGWTRPALSCTREGRTLYGRGAADMKGTIVAVLAALRAADRAGVALYYAPHLLLCTDEEGGAYPGIRYLAEQGMIDGHLLSFNGTAAARIWGGCFGSMDLRIGIDGYAAHSGEGDGVNAIDAALPVLNALAALKTVVEQRIAAAPGPKGALYARLNVTAIRGGEKGSAVPGRVELLVNRRYLPEEESDDVRAEIEACVAGALQGGIARGHDITLAGHLAPVLDPGGSHWPRWQRALSAGWGFPAEAFRRWAASSSSDMGWVQRAGIQEILLGGLAKPERRIHGPDEHTTINDITALARSVLLYLAADFDPDLIPELIP